MYIWRVIYDDRVAEVEAVDKLRAIQAAARQWGLAWTNIARACLCERMGEVNAVPKRPRSATGGGGAKKKRGGGGGT